MQFKGLDWNDSFSDNVIIASNCIIKVYSSIKIEFRIAYDKEENKYSLYSFGQGSVRRLMPDVFATVDEAKSAAYKFYSNEMCRMKKAIDSFLIEE